MQETPNKERYISDASHLVLDRYFEHNRYFATFHHLHSYNEFLQKGLRTIVRSMNPDFKMIKKDVLMVKGEERTIVRSVQVIVGGDDEATGVYVDRPVVLDAKTGTTRVLFPNEARLRGMTYACNVYCDIRLDFEADGRPIGSKMLERYRIGQIPLMLHSDMCVLHDQPSSVLKEMGECVWDQGGYFIIGGKEKVVVARESLVHNRLFVTRAPDADKPPFVEFYAKVSAVDPDGDLFPKTVHFLVYKNDVSQKRNAVDVMMPNVKGKLPLFVLFRALGLESDYDIFAACLGAKMHVVSEQTHILRSCALAAARLGVFDQLTAAQYIVERTNYKTTERMKQILADDLFPNTGKAFDKKIVYLAYLVGKLLRACAGVDNLTNRDTYEHKRVNVTGTKMASLFRDVYARFRKVARNMLDREYFSGPWRRNAGDNVEEVVLSLMNLVNASNVRTIFNASIVDVGMINSFKGQWNVDDTANPGRENEFKEEGVVQELSRISYIAYISHVRRVVWAGNVPKIKAPHLLYGTQWGAVCPVESPDGPNIGITKHLATLCHVTGFVNPNPLVQHLLDLELFLPLGTPLGDVGTAEREGGKKTEVEKEKEIATQRNEVDIDFDNDMFAVRFIVNDILVGTSSPKLAVAAERYLLTLRRNGLLHPMTSVLFQVFKGEFMIFTDAGRCARPLLVTEMIAPPEEPGHTHDPAQTRANVLRDQLPRMSWTDMLLGSLLTAEQKAAVLPRSTGVAATVFHPNADVTHKYLARRHEDVKTTTEALRRSAGVLEFVDAEEMNVRLIAVAPLEFQKRPCQRYTHCEVHPSTILSLPAACVPFMDRNQAPRNVYSMAQTKQSMGLPFTNFDNRMDTMSAVLHYPQLPIVTTTFAERLCDGKLTYGENLIVAIATFTGYNQEDAVIFNRDSLMRGAFGTTHFHTVSFEEAVESKERILVTNPLLDAGIDYGDERAAARAATPQEADAIRKERSEDRRMRYASITDAGLPREGALLQEGDILVGRVHVLTELIPTVDSVGFSRTEQREIRTDASVVVDRSTVGYVDRVFYNGGKGKVRINQIRVPEFGDKCASRHGQKGVVGMVVPGYEMPFSSVTGTTPDLIINPHAIPSRMTCGHLLECALAKLCTYAGKRVACDNFEKSDVLGTLLENEYDIQKYGDEIMYNGRTGQQIPVAIFVGPTYYMRLKHMVADKINQRATGPMTAITRQPNKGRGKHGGLRIGEMEQQALQSHGAATFLREAFMERSDKYYMDVDANEGVPVAVSNPVTRQVIPYEENNVDVRRVAVPYAWKVMQQELQALGVDVRLLLDTDADEPADEDDRRREMLSDARPKIVDLVRDVLHNDQHFRTIGECAADDDYAFDVTGCAALNRMMQQQRQRQDGKGRFRQLYDDDDDVNEDAGEEDEGLKLPSHHFVLHEKRRDLRNEDDEEDKNNRSDGDAYASSHIGEEEDKAPLMDDNEKGVVDEMTADDDDA